MDGESHNGLQKARSTGMREAIPAFCVSTTWPQQGMGAWGSYPSVVLVGLMVGRVEENRTME